MNVKTFLLPPSIDGKLPAQTGDVLSIPFTHNRAVGYKDFNSMKLKITSISTNQIIDVVDLYNLNNEEDIAYFQLQPTVKLNVGEFYKAQLAYQSNDIVGYYSSVGVFKYTIEPTISVDEYENNPFKIYGFYNGEGDISEKPYSYQFNLYDSFNRLILTSGEQFYNISKGYSRVEYDCTKMYSLNDYHYWEFQVNTINGLTVKHKKEFIVKKLEAVVDATVVLDSDNKHGRNIITIVDGDGPYLLVKSTDGINYTILNDTMMNPDIYHDYIVEQGVPVYYDIYKYDAEQAGFYTLASPLMSIIDFEDMYLLDNEAQLCIRFNPKVSSFKEVYLETKQDTLGGRFPIFQRNGNTQYKEMSLSGLLTYHMDNEQLFLPKLKNSDATRKSTMSDMENDNNLYDTNLTGQNIKLERDFKLKALSWLNNGKPKLFRSPTEGNYIVRIMNVSLSPEDQLGRMIHSFQATAYEVEEYTWENLLKFNLVSTFNGVLLATIQGDLLQDNNSHYLATTE